KGVAKISHSECSRFNIQIEQLNEKNMMEIPPLSNTWNLANLLRKKAEILARNMKEKEIQSKVESRFSMMNGDRKRMLLSLLNKPVNKIKIDRVLKEEENFYQNSELVVEETKVKEYVIKYFEKQFQERKHKFEKL
ncbi:35538_t:CDS:2, partial [Gigaspora margarita]